MVGYYLERLSLAAIKSPPRVFEVPSDSYMQSKHVIKLSCLYVVCMSSGGAELKTFGFGWVRGDRKLKSL